MPETSRWFWAKGARAKPSRQIHGRAFTGQKGAGHLDPHLQPTWMSAATIVNLKLVACSAVTFETLGRKPPGHVEESKVPMPIPCPSWRKRFSSTGKARGGPSSVSQRAQGRLTIGLASVHETWNKAANHTAQGRSSHVTHMWWDTEVVPGSAFHRTKLTPAAPRLLWHPAVIQGRGYDVCDACSLSPALWLRVKDEVPLRVTASLGHSLHAGSQLSRGGWPGA